MPPYDIIRDTNRYYNADPHNIVRIDKGRDEADDDGTNNKYSRAKQNIDRWLEEGVLVRDNKKSFYVYAQEYVTPDGAKHEMSGFFGLCKLEEFDNKVVLPHEKTHSGPKVDRLNLMRATKSNTSPILSLYFDPEREIDELLRKHIEKEAPFLSCKDEDGINYRLWKVSDEQETSDIETYFMGKQLFIADGHHRYETGINYRNEIKTARGIKGESPFDYILMCFISMEHSGITILPTHRLKKHFGAEITGALGLEKFFEVEKLKDKKELRLRMLASSGKKIIGVYGRGMCMLLKLKKNEYEKVLNVSDHIMDYYMLDASILHKLLFERILNLGEQDVNDGIDYTPDIDEAISRVDNGSAEITFLLGPATVAEVRTISENGEVMPQKSTYFLPKLATGFLINQMEA
jgi:uncharacterized protein (DUF1015 family)